MFTYCLNNPIRYSDKNGAYAEALEWWPTTMWWLGATDNVLPFGDIIYFAGCLLFSPISYDRSFEVNESKLESEVGSPPPNDDDDNDDDYYDDDNNFGGRQSKGHSNGKTPQNNQAQNRQFRDATKGLSAEQRRIVHDAISRTGVGFHEIVEIVEFLFGESP